MSDCTKTLCFLIIGLGLANSNSLAQTDGGAKLEASIFDYTGSSSARHWTVVWVTTGAGAFIKTVWIQGNNNNYWASHWNNHCGQWYAARAGSQALDGYSSATAQNYTGTNSPVILTWNCRDASDNLVADGSYKFWVQYAEDAGQGPYTTSGLLWTKGPIGETNTYADQAANFASMKVSWMPVIPPAPPTPAEFTAAQIQGNHLVLSGTGPTNGTYRVLVATNANALAAQWTPIATNSCDASGNFRFTNVISSGVTAKFYRLQTQ